MIKIKRFLEYRKCILCKNDYLKVDINRINDKEYICHRCSMENGYATRNTGSKGKKTQSTFSFEFETDLRTNELFELIKYGFIACRDSSIEGIEWKSPIYNNKKCFHTDCRKLDKFKQYVGNSCGTHLHCGTKYKNILQKYRVQIFEPLLIKMIEKRDETEKFWGRYFTSYCSDPIEAHSRYCAINVWSNVETLEYRLLKFKNAKQYIKACDFCIDTTKYINFIIRKGDFDEEKAIKLGETILKKYEEVVQNVQTNNDE